MDVLIADVIGDVALVLVASWLMGALARKYGDLAAAGLGQAVRWAPGHASVPGGKPPVAIGPQ